MDGVIDVLCRRSGCENQALILEPKLCHSCYATELAWRESHWHEWARECRQDMPSLRLVALNRRIENNWREKG